MIFVHLSRQLFVIDNRVVQMDDFREAMAKMYVSSMRGHTVEVNKTSWEDVGGLEHVKQVCFSNAHGVHHFDGKRLTSHLSTETEGGCGMAYCVC